MRLDVASRHGGGVYDELSNAVPAKEFLSQGKITLSEKLSVIFPSPGTYSISFLCTLLDGSTVDYVDVVDAYYVRRELRELSIRDKNLFLDTFLTLYHTGAAEGVKLFGTHYKPLSYFEKMHLDAAASRRVDHIHDGMGFLTQHMALTAEMELALQSVEPSLTIPYWDYTIDSVEIQKASAATGRGAVDATIFDDSILFAEDFFGQTSGKAHTVTSGRFAHLSVPVIRGSEQEAIDTISPRGFLRAPWNLNPNKYVTRYHKVCGEDIILADDTDLQWPTCESHRALSNAGPGEVFSWYDWVWAASYKPHGPVHAWIGGIGGECEEAFSTLKEKGFITVTQEKLLKHSSFEILKNMWRHFLIEVPKVCAEDAPVSECTWTCIHDVESHVHAKALLSYANITESNTPHFSEVAKEVFCDTTWW